jgi:predicted pyridoxine 5'-phosphate oxidase superfamily flavin-nucleotide-binding protein
MKNNILSRVTILISMSNDQGGGPDGRSSPPGHPESIMSRLVPRLASSDVAFTPAVKAVQARKGSRPPSAFEREISDDLAAFLAEQTTAFLATASAQGQPYVQHRGGPPGFLQVLDAHTLAFADLRGNRQYVSLGNLSENPRVLLLVMDYAHRQRVKIWGTARVVEDQPALLARLTPAGERADQAIVIAVSAWDGNCPQHLPQLLGADAVAAALAAKDARIAELEAALRAGSR